MRLQDAGIENAKKIFDDLREISTLILSQNYDKLSNYSAEPMDEGRIIAYEEYIEDYPYELYPWRKDVVNGSYFQSYSDGGFIVEAPFCELENGKYIGADIQFIVEFSESMECDFLRVELL